MKKFLRIILFFFLIITACSTVKVLDEKALEDIEPQYLEELSTAKVSEDSIMTELMNLHKTDYGIYKIKAGDKFHIFVYEEPDLDTDDVIVKPDGSLTFKLIGEVKVQGLTVPQATAKIEEGLKKYIKFPKVTMSNYSLKSSRITVLGKVTYPGIIEIDNSTKILDVIAQAGGLAMGYFQNNSIELADLENSYIIRNNKLLPVDFQKLIRAGKMIYNIPLLDGDYIFFPSSINREVYVLGEVNEQGHFAYKENMTLLQILSYAQGIKRSAGKKAFIIRGNLSHPRLFAIDVREIMKANKQDFRLKPNDIVYIPSNMIADWNTVMSNLLPTLQASKLMGF